MEFELPKINVSFEYDEEKDEIVFVINGVEKRVKTEDMITEMEELQEQNTALEREPCEDCISREHLLSEISDLKKSPWFNYGKDKKDFRREQYNARKEAVEIVEDLCIKKEPSIQPKPKTGWWIDNSCSNCGIYNASAYKSYCPNCGAKMLPTDLQFGDQDTLMSAT